MYRCDECKRVFEHPAKDKEYHPEVGESEEWRLCPCCGSVDFETVYRDRRGEEWITEGHYSESEMTEIEVELAELLVNHGFEEHQYELIEIIDEILERKWK